MMKITQRRGLRRAGNLFLPRVAQVIVVAATLSVARAQDAPGLAGLLGHLAPDMACVAPQVVGPCFCGPLACGLRIRRFVPVALVETTRAPGDSLLAPGLMGAAVPNVTASSALSTTDNTAEAHVWALPDGPLPGLGCLACGPSAARLPAPVSDTAAVLANAPHAASALAFVGYLTGPNGRAYLRRFGFAVP